jgi:ArsR family transcriptional regulator
MGRPDAVEISELHARVCKALADPKRLLIINELRDGPRSVGEIAEALGTSQPNASRHLALLRDRGIVTGERAGSTVFYALTSPKILRAVDLLREFMAEELGWHPATRIQLDDALDRADREPVPGSVPAS